MLKTRLLTALVLVPLVFWGVLELPNDWFALVLAAVVLAGIWELANLCGLHGIPARLAAVVIMAAVLWMLFDVRHSPWATWFIEALAVGWLLNILLLLSGMIVPRRKDAVRPLLLLTGMTVLAGVWLAMVRLHGMASHGPGLMMFFLILIWVADSGAYFGGRRFGKRKLAPAVSPGKSWEGVFCALLLTGLYALLAASLFGLSGNQWPAFVVLSLVTVMFSVLGDLAESMFKRHAGVKDSGTLLPGHGGVLDRIDSITSAAPLFVVGFWLGDFQF